MNRAILKQRLDDWADQLVSDFGVQREDAVSIMGYVNNRAIVSSAEAADDAQFLLDFRRFRSERLGEIHGKSGQAMRKRHADILRKSQPAVAVAVAK